MNIKLLLIRFPFSAANKRICIVVSICTLTYFVITDNECRNYYFVTDKRGFYYLLKLWIYISLAVTFFKNIIYYLNRQSILKSMVNFIFMKFSECPSFKKILSSTNKRIVFNDSQFILFLLKHEERIYCGFHCNNEYSIKYKRS